MAKYLPKYSQSHYSPRLKRIGISNLSAENFTKHVTLMSGHLSLRYGHVILVCRYPVFDRCRLTTTTYAISRCRLPIQLENMTFRLGTDGGTNGRTYGHVITKFLGWIDN